MAVPVSTRTIHSSAAVNPSGAMVTGWPPITAPAPLAASHTCEENCSTVGTGTAVTVSQTTKTRPVIVSQPAIAAAAPASRPASAPGSTGPAITSSGDGSSPEATVSLTGGRRRSFVAGMTLHARARRDGPQPDTPGNR
ncbi:MAG: hypothetical protein HZY73_13480 [Micropruina sp.]|nr:MAG: hypothetical protein HZY73_13480 [Micropruina sp.]